MSRTKAFLLQIQSLFPMLGFGFVLLTFVPPTLAQDSLLTGYATVSFRQGKASFAAAGYRDREASALYHSLTLQPVGSVSKLIVGLSLMKAVDQGLVSLDAPIGDFLPFTLENPHGKNGAKITLRHLATHTSGILDVESTYAEAYQQGLNEQETLGEFLQSYLDSSGKRYSKRNFAKGEPGEEFSYSNIGAALAAWVIELAAGVSFEEFSTQHVLRPLGMEDSHWLYKANRLSDYARLYDERDAVMDYYTLITYPDGGLKTNASDLSKLLEALILGYQGKSDLLQKDSWRVFFEKNFDPALPPKGLTDREPNYGIFVTYAKSGLIGHTGSDPGVFAVLFFDPKTFDGKLLVTNEDLLPQNLAFFQSIWQKL